MITLRQVSKWYASPRRKTIAVKDINLTFERGKITTIFGANGSGKSTLLAIISGLISPDTGTVQFSPDNPRIGYVFQDFRNSLLPWRTVRSNILLPIAWQGKTLSAGEDRLKKLLSLFTIDLPLDRYPHQISGGQAQMACLLRALIIEPQIAVLDEPTSALDYTLQSQTVLQLQRLWSDESITTIIVSHDPDQAILLADRIVIMGPGCVSELVDVRLPRPRTLATTYTADFLKLRELVLSRFDITCNNVSDKTNK